MEFFDLKEQYRNLKSGIDAAVLDVLKRGVFIGGSEVLNFEREAAEFLGLEYAIGLNSGTDALILALKALGVRQGDEVIVPDFTFIATADAAAQCGAMPVFCDINRSSFNIDSDKIEEKITAKTKAIIPVHLFGRAADMDAILAIAKKHNLFVIEDAAQAMGAEYNGKLCGTMGDVGCFSFFPTKNLGAFGDGGMLATNNVQVADKIKLLRSHGSSLEDKYRHIELGFNSRLDAVQAAILRVKLPHLNEWNARRNALAKNYNDGLSGIGDIVLPEVGGGRSCVFHQYAIRTDRRDELAGFLKKEGVPTMVYYPTPLHLQPAFGYLGGQAGDFSEAEGAAREVLCLPIYPEFGENHQRLIIGKITEFFNK
jgi:dTDP-4-amino-4,6-dideoxygalactose transaminase